MMNMKTWIKPFIRGLWLKEVNKYPSMGFAHDLGETEFKASDCWLNNWNWKGRYATIFM